MNCDTAVALMVDAAGGSITPEGRAALDGHVKKCAACAAALAEFDAAAPVAAAALRDAQDAPAPGFDGRVRAMVADGAARRDRSAARLIPRLAYAGALAALIVLTASVFVTDLFRGRAADVPIESALNLYASGSIYEPQTREEVTAVEEEMFSTAFPQKDLEVIDGALNGDLEDQIEELDDASLKAFEEQIDTVLKNHSSG